MAQKDIAQEKYTLERFVELLKEEQQALISGQTDVVMRLVDQKMACAEALQASLALNEALKLESERHVLHPLVREARQLNAANGHLIGDQLQRLRLSLSRLQALAPAPVASTTYGRDGNENARGARSLGVA